MELSQKDIDRFNGKVAKSRPNECWPWTGAVFDTGYGAFWLAGNNVGAHRVALFLARGQTSAREHGTNICHTCHNPRCVNPAHLYLGTVKDNAHDRRDNGTHFQGQEVGTSQLTEAQIIEARERVRSGETVTDVARDMMVPFSGLYQAVTGSSWAHLDEDHPPVKYTKTRLTEQDVKRLRTRAHAGEEIKQLAIGLGMSTAAVGAAVRGQTWAHVTDPPPVRKRRKYRTTN